MFSGAVVLQMSGFARVGFSERGRGEGSFESEGTACAGGFLCFEHDLQHMQRVLGRVGRPRAAMDAFHRVAEAIAPRPIRGGFPEHLPGACRVHSWRKSCLVLRYSWGS